MDYDAAIYVKHLAIGHDISHQGYEKLVSRVTKNIKRFSNGEIAKFGMRKMVHVNTYELWLYLTLILRNNFIKHILRHHVHTDKFLQADAVYWTNWYREICICTTETNAWLTQGKIHSNICQLLSTDEC